MVSFVGEKMVLLRLNASALGREAVRYSAYVRMERVEQF